MTGMNENPLDLLPEVPARRVGGPRPASAVLAAAPPPVGRPPPSPPRPASRASRPPRVAATGPATTAFGDAFAVDPVTTVAGSSSSPARSSSSPCAVGPLEATPARASSTSCSLTGRRRPDARRRPGPAAARRRLPAGEHPRVRARRLRQGRAGTEAALKYYVVGALLGVVLLAGVTVLLRRRPRHPLPELRPRCPSAPAALSPSARSACWRGLLFKAGGVPAHFWVPDAVRGQHRPGGRAASPPCPRSGRSPPSSACSPCPSPGTSSTGPLLLPSSPPPP